MITISTDKTRLDPSVIHHFLTNSYWAKGIPYENVVRRIKNALCFGVYDGENQIGFARVISDYESFAYLADVFILESHRGQGLSKRLMETISTHPDLQNLRRFMLATADAHGLYAQYGFQEMKNVERWMEKIDLTVYLKNIVNT
jgi:GNAT superfamily N-acetyltransferase